MNTAAALETVPCDLCGSTNLERLYSKPDEHYHPNEYFTVDRCRECGLGFLNPRPTQQAMDRFYPRSFFERFVHEAQRHDIRYTRECEFLEQHVPQAILTDPERRLLDVGCANGAFARKMIRRGWHVEGLEIGSQAEDVDDFVVHGCLLNELTLPNASFDVITAWAVLEHVLNPRACFEAAARLLKPGGVFIFLVTNFESTSSHSLYREDIPRHTYHFTESTVQRYLEDNGLQMAHVHQGNDIYRMTPVGWLVHLIGRACGHERLPWKKMPVNRTKWISDRGLRLGLLSTMRYVARHPIWTLDRAIVPLYVAWQIRSKSYGIVTYVGTKPSLS